MNKLLADVINLELAMSLLEASVNTEQKEDEECQTLSQE